MSQPFQPIYYTFKWLKAPFRLATNLVQCIAGKTFAATYLSATVTATSVKKALKQFRLVVGCREFAVAKCVVRKYEIFYFYASTYTGEINLTQDTKELNLAQHGELNLTLDTG